jgi:hypothetical protein
MVTYGTGSDRTRERERCGEGGRILVKDLRNYS